MNKNAVYGIVMALLIPVISYFLLKKATDNAIVMPRHYIYDSVAENTVNGKKMVDTIWHTLPPMALTNQLGQKVGWDDIGKKIIVADFFFTHCPTICPRMTVNMKRLQDGISTISRAGNTPADFVQFLSFSVDPERDSVPELKKWADRYQIDPDSWWLLTGDKKEIYDMSIEHMKVLAQDGKGVDTSFFHTDYMVLIDKDRHIRGYYHGLDSTGIARLSNDIVLLSLEKDPKRKSFFAGKLMPLALLFLATFLGIGILFFFLKKDKKANESRGS
ncbi:MAG: SCO family protein [Chitinophagaceae bacterium]